MAIGRPISLTPNIATKNISSLATADQTEFTVTGGYRINEIAVYRNGVRLAEGRDFTASDGDTVNLVTAATVDDVIEFAVFDSFDVAGTIVSAASSQNLNGDFNVTGALYAGTFNPTNLVSAAATITRLTNTNLVSTAATFNSTLHVGSALTTNAAGDVETVGIITAASFSGSGANLTGVASTDNIITGTAATFRNTAVSAGVPNVNIVGLATVGILTAYGDIAGTTGTFSGAVSGTTGTFSGAVSGTTGTFSAAVSGTTGTFSGAVNVDATTDSTSSTSGALIVDGGLGVAKNVYIGAGLSVAGTLTYEDVTNVDSVGLITAKSGVNVTGGQLTVGTAYSVGAAGIVTAAGFVGPLTGNVTGNASGSALNVTQAAQTNITSLGTLSALTISGNLTLDNGADAGKDLTWNTAADALQFNDDVYAHFGSGSDLKIYHNGSHSLIEQSGTGNLYIRPKAGEDGITLVADGAVTLSHDNSPRLATTNDGTVVTGIATATLGIDAAISVWTLGADGTSHYTFTGPGNLSATSDPTLNLIRGQKYTFKNRSGGHPFRIQSTANGSAGTQYNTGVTNNDGGDGTNILFDVPHDAPSILYYQCTSHGSMGGAMYISGSAYETKIGSNITLGTAGVVTATKYIGDGSGLTGVGGDTDITSCLFV